jgi:hypothetical protein
MQSTWAFFCWQITKKFLLCGRAKYVPHLVCGRGGWWYFRNFAICGGGGILRCSESAGSGLVWSGHGCREWRSAVGVGGGWGEVVKIHASIHMGGREGRGRWGDLRNFGKGVLVECPTDSPHSTFSWKIIEFGGFTRSAMGKLVQPQFDRSLSWLSAKSYEFWVVWTRAESKKIVVKTVWTLKHFEVRLFQKLARFLRLFETRWYFLSDVSLPGVIGRVRVGVAARQQQRGSDEVLVWSYTCNQTFATPCASAFPSFIWHTPVG